MMHPEDEANTDAPLVPHIRQTDRPTTATPWIRQPARQPTEPDPLQPHLSSIRGRWAGIDDDRTAGGDRR